jgi:hypothetical protein
LSRLIVITALAMLLSSPAYAYLDPGTGSILLQGLLAALAAASAAVAAFWSQIRRLLSGRRDSKALADESESDSSSS